MSSPESAFRSTGAASSRQHAYLEGRDRPHAGPVHGNQADRGFTLRIFGEFKQLSKSYVVYVLGRRSKLPEGYSTQDMAEDYAAVIKDEFDGGPIDVMGMSYGGLIAQHLAADNPQLIRRLVIAMSVYRFSEKGNNLDLRFAELLSKNKTRAAFSSLGDAVDNRIKRRVLKSFLWLIGPLMFSKPEPLSDVLVEGKAEMAHNTRDRLAEIRAPTLVIGGDQDFYCPAERLRETAAEIQDSRLVLYEGKGHTTMGKQFDLDILAFLNE